MGWGVAWEWAVLLIFFHFKLVHSRAFSSTNAKVLFAIKCKKRYVITVFLAINSDTNIKRQDVINLVNPVQSVISNLSRFHSYSTP